MYNGVKSWHVSVAIEAGGSAQRQLVRYGVLQIRPRNVDDPVLRIFDGHSLVPAILILDRIEVHLHFDVGAVFVYVSSLRARREPAFLVKYSKKISSRHSWLDVR